LVLDLASAWRRFCSSPLDFRMVFSSFKANTGKNRAKSRKSVKKMPRVPMKTPTSMLVALN
jgi:hypothetical protein